MNEIAMFAEDFGHEAVISPLIERHAQEVGLQVNLTRYSVRGGHGRAISELKQYLRDINILRLPRPDLLVVAIDSNCRGFNDVHGEVEAAVREVGISRALAIPDPHIERWLLLDSAAFKRTLGKGCRAPDLKCDRSRYKALLAQAVREAGLTPLIGGVEHAEDIVNAMDLDRMRQRDHSLGKFLEELRRAFKGWVQS